MKIKKSSATPSAIVVSGERIRQLQTESGQECVMLQRGINAVCSINITKVVAKIDFNSGDLQNYPGTKGKKALRTAINKEYFDGSADEKNILITGGAISGLDLTFQLLDVDKIYVPTFFWGTYMQVMRVRNVDHAVYPDLEFLAKNATVMSGSAVVVCDPNNPLGNKYDDVKLLETIRLLNENGVITIFDSPYRRVFYDSDDTLYQELARLKNVVIVESFSKSVGLSGQRIGFLYANSAEFMNDAALRLLYSTNGVNAFAQILITDLLTTQEGKKAVSDFKQITRKGIAKNIEYLRKNNLLADEFYKASEPMGIFVVIKKSAEELFENYIGSVPINYFTLTDKEKYKNFARICVSVPHKKFCEFIGSLK